MPKELTYDYYETPYTTLFYPNRGPSNGANLQRHQGFGYMLSRPHLNDQLWARLVNMETHAPLTEDIEITGDNLSVDEWSWNLPEVSGPMEAMIQITLNQQQWHNVYNLESGKSYIFYAAPHVTGISPAFGHVKTTKDQIIEISGTGFACYDDECSDLLCRFGNNPDEYIFSKATLASSTLVKCKVP